MMNPILFTVFGIEVRWYSMLLLTGMIISIIMLIREGKRFNIPKDFSFNLAFWVIIIGIISARVYYCVFNFSLYKDNLLDIFKIWEGGLAIYGGLIGGIIAAFITCKLEKLNFLNLLDCAGMSLLIGQGIGRWGNYANQEAFGVFTNGNYGMMSDKVVAYIQAHPELYGLEGVSDIPTYIEENNLFVFLAP